MSDPGNGLPRTPVMDYRTPRSSMTALPGNGLPRLTPGICDVRARRELQNIRTMRTRVNRVRGLRVVRATCGYLFTVEQGVLPLEDWSETNRPTCIRCHTNPAPFGRTRCLPCQAVTDAQCQTFGRMLTAAELKILDRNR